MPRFFQAKQQIYISILKQTIMQNFPSVTAPVNNDTRPLFYLTVVQIANKVGYLKFK